MDPSTLRLEPDCPHYTSFRIEALACDLAKPPLRPTAAAALKIQSASNGFASEPAVRSGLPRSSRLGGAVNI
jgi:hypothetical protein